MAMNLGSKCVRRSARRFVAGRGGRDLESSTGLARASQIVRFYGTCSDASSDDRPGYWLLGSINGWLCMASIVVLCYGGGYLRKLARREEWLRISILESDRALRIAIEENGITREMCEAKIAQLTQKTESSEHDRFVLQIIQGWLKLLPKDKSGVVGGGGSRISHMGVDSSAAKPNLIKALKILPRREGLQTLAEAPRSSKQHGFYKSGIAASQSSTQHGFFKSGK